MQSPKEVGEHGALRIGQSAAGLTGRNLVRACVRGRVCECTCSVCLSNLSVSGRSGWRGTAAAASPPSIHPSIHIPQISHAATASATRFPWPPLWRVLALALLPNAGGPLDRLPLFSVSLRPALLSRPLTTTTTTTHHDSRPRMLSCHACLSACPACHGGAVTP